MAFDSFGLELCETFFNVGSDVFETFFNATFFFWGLFMEGPVVPREDFLVFWGGGVHSCNGTSTYLSMTKELVVETWHQNLHNSLVLNE